MGGVVRDVKHVLHIRSHRQAVRPADVRFLQIIEVTLSMLIILGQRAVGIPAYNDSAVHQAVGVYAGVSNLELVGTVDQGIGPLFHGEGRGEFLFDGLALVPQVVAVGVQRARDLKGDRRQIHRRIRAGQRAPQLLPFDDQFRLQAVGDGAFFQQAVFVRLLDVNLGRRLAMYHIALYRSLSIIFRAIGRSLVAVFSGRIVKVRMLHLDILCGIVEILVALAVILRHAQFRAPCMASIGCGVDPIVLEVNFRFRQLAILQRDAVNVEIDIRASSFRFRVLVLPLFIPFDDFGAAERVGNALLQVRLGMRAVSGILHVAISHRIRRQPFRPFRHRFARRGIHQHLAHDIVRHCAGRVVHWQSRKDIRRCAARREANRLARAACHLHIAAAQADGAVCIVDVIPFALRICGMEFHLQCKGITLLCYRLGKKRARGAVAVHPCFFGGDFDVAQPAVGDRVPLQAVDGKFSVGRIIEVVLCFIFMARMFRRCAGWIALPICDVLPAHRCLQDVDLIGISLANAYFSEVLVRFQGDAPDFFVGFPIIDGKGDIFAVRGIAVVYPDFADENRIVLARRVDDEGGIAAVLFHPVVMGGGPTLGTRCFQEDILIKAAVRIVFGQAGEAPLPCFHFLKRYAFPVAGCALRVHRTVHGCRNVGLPVKIKFLAGNGPVQCDCDFRALQRFGRVAVLVLPLLFDVVFGGIGQPIGHGGMVADGFRRALIVHVAQHMVLKAPLPEHEAAVGLQQVVRAAFALVDPRFHPLIRQRHTRRVVRGQIGYRAGARQIVRLEAAHAHGHRLTVLAGYDLPFVLVRRPALKRKFHGHILKFRLESRSLPLFGNGERRGADDAVGDGAAVIDVGGLPGHAIRQNVGTGDYIALLIQPAEDLLIIVGKFSGHIFSGAVDILIPVLVVLWQGRVAECTVFIRLHGDDTAVAVICGGGGARVAALAEPPELDFDVRAIRVFAKIGPELCCLKTLFAGQDQVGDAARVEGVGIVGEVGRIGVVIRHVKIVAWFKDVVPNLRVVPVMFDGVDQQRAVDVVLPCVFDCHRGGIYAVSAAGDGDARPAAILAATGAGQFAQSDGVVFVSISAVQREIIAQNTSNLLLGQRCLAYAQVQLQLHAALQDVIGAQVVTNRRELRLILFRDDDARIAARVHRCAADVRNIPGKLMRRLCAKDIRHGILCRQRRANGQRIRADVFRDRQLGHGRCGKAQRCPALRRQRGFLTVIQPECERQPRQVRLYLLHGGTDAAFIIIIHPVKYLLVRGRIIFDNLVLVIKARKGGADSKVVDRGSGIARAKDPCGFRLVHERVAGRRVGLHAPGDGMLALPVRDADGQHAGGDCQGEQVGRIPVRGGKDGIRHGLHAERSQRLLREQRLRAPFDGEIEGGLRKIRQSRAGLKHVAVVQEGDLHLQRPGIVQCLHRLPGRRPGAGIPVLIQAQGPPGFAQAGGQDERASLVARGKAHELRAVIRKGNGVRSACVGRVHRDGSAVCGRGREADAPFHGKSPAQRQRSALQADSGSCSGKRRVLQREEASGRHGKQRAVKRGAAAFPAIGHNGRALRIHRLRTLYDKGAQAHDAFCTARQLNGPLQRQHREEHALPVVCVASCAGGDGPACVMDGRSAGIPIYGVPRALQGQPHRTGLHGLRILLRRQCRHPVLRQKGFRPCLQDVLGARRPLNILPVLAVCGYLPLPYQSLGRLAGNIRRKRRRAADACFGGRYDGLDSKLVRLFVLLLRAALRLRLGEQLYKLRHHIAEGFPVFHAIPRRSVLSGLGMAHEHAVPLLLHKEDVVALCGTRAQVYVIVGDNSLPSDGLHRFRQVAVLRFSVPFLIPVGLRPGAKEVHDRQGYAAFLRVDHMRRCRNARGCALLIRLRRQPGGPDIALARLRAVFKRKSKRCLHPVVRNTFDDVDDGVAFKAP